MSYFPRDGAFHGQPQGLGRAEDVENLDRATQAAFEKLPTETQLKAGTTTFALATGGPVAFRVRLPFQLPLYPDGTRLAVRVPVASGTRPTLTLETPDQSPDFGPFPILDASGRPPREGEFAPGYSVLLVFDQSNELPEIGAHWTIAGGTRGREGPAGPPAGRFSIATGPAGTLSDIMAGGNLIFDPDGPEGAYSLGKVAPTPRGEAVNGTTYRFLDLVRSGAGLYLHIQQDDSILFTGAGEAPSGQAKLTDAAVWQTFVDPPSPSVLYKFSTATQVLAQPANGAIRANTASPAADTEYQLAVHHADAIGNDLAGYIATFDQTGQASDRGLLFIRDRVADRLSIWRVKSLADNTTWTQLTVQFIAGVLPVAQIGNTMPLCDVWFLGTGNALQDLDPAGAIELFNGKVRLKNPANSGLITDANGLKVNVGPGLVIPTAGDDAGKLMAAVAAAGGLEIAADGLAVKIDGSWFASSATGLALADAVIGSLSMKNWDINTRAANYTVAPSDRMKILRVTGATARTLTLPDISGTSILPGFMFWVVNASTETLTLDPNGGDTIGDTATATWELQPGQAALVAVGAPTHWDVLGQGGGSGLRSATTGRAGVVRLADAADMRARTTERVVTSDIAHLGPGYTLVDFANPLAWDAAAAPRGWTILTGDTAIAVSGLSDGGFYSLILRQDAIGGHAVSYPATWLWTDATVIQVSEDANTYNQLMLHRFGTLIFAEMRAKLG